MNSSCSNAISAGLKKSGFDPKLLHQQARIQAGRIAAVVAEHSQFSGREVELIERRSKLTDGQLAARSIEPDGGSLTDLMDEWASVAVSPI